jgi:hypothetical protein
MTEESGVNSVTVSAILKGGQSRISSKVYDRIQSYYEAFKSAMPEDGLPAEEEPVEASADTPEVFQGSVQNFV